MKTIRKQSVSDSKHVEVLQKAGLAASVKARRESVALGLVVKYIEGDNIIELQPDGQKTIIGTVEKKSVTIPVLKKGMILNRK